MLNDYGIVGLGVEFIVVLTSYCSYIHSSSSTRRHSTNILKWWMMNDYSIVGLEVEFIVVLN